MAKASSPREIRRMRLLRRLGILAFAAVTAVSTYAFTLEEAPIYQNIVAVATFLILSALVIVDIVATRGIEMEGGIEAIAAGGDVSTGAVAQAGRLYVKGEGFRLLTNPREAERLYKDALSIYESEGDAAGAGRTHISLGLVARMMGEESKAVQSFEKAETALRENGQGKLAGFALLAKGDFLLAKGGSGGDTLEVFDVVREEAKANQDRQMEAHAILGWGQAAIGTQNHEESKSALDQARFAFSQVGDRTGEAHALVVRGSIDRDEKKYTEAASRYERSIGLYRQCGDFIGQGLAEVGLSEVRRKMDRTPDAVSLLLSAAGLFKRAGRRIGGGDLTSGRGDLMRGTYRFKRVRQDVEFAMSLIRDQNDKAQEAEMAMGLGELSRMAGDLNEAQSLFEKAKLAAGNANDSSLMADVNKGYGNVARARNNARGAKGYYKDAHALYQRGSTRSQADILMEIGQVDFLMENLDGARVDFNHAQSYYQSSDDMHGQASALRALGDLEMSVSNVEQGMQHFADARNLFQQVGDVQAAADCMLLIGIINVGADNAAANALLVAAARLYKAVGSPWWQRTANVYAHAVR